ncbi:ATP-binding cassette domain-containing protein [Chromatium okenii]|uniref:ATP-binding cassette domain-containing protein n=1 Tax=Chromatium okenii TaxID=61644 RepID=UPI001F5B92A1|nr:ATP-binding cassette domain-containing protein [Chromatium okenii]
MTNPPTPLFQRGAFLISPLRKRGAGGISGFELYIPSLTIRPGAVVVLRGASGCGKSTLLDLLALALRPDAAATFNLCPEHRQPTD